jgi:type I restriction enzyme S subunit
VSNWKKSLLGDYINVKHGFAFPGHGITAEETENVLVTPGNFYIGGGFKSDKFKYFFGDFPSAYALSEGDLVVTMTDLSKEGDTLGYGAKIPRANGKRYLHNQRIGLVQFLSDGADKEFLYWILRTKEYQSYILGAATGTSVRHTSPTTIKQYVFDKPELNEQKSIAAVLNSFEDKINLLHRQNKTLEAMAEALFRRWFVEGAGDWSTGRLGDEFDFTMGQSPPGSSFNENGTGMPMFQGNADFGFRFPEKRIYTTEPTRFAKPMDTLISVRAPVGAQNMANEECCIGRGLAAFRYKNNSAFYTYTYFKLRSLMHEITKFNDEGTVFGSISKSDFEAISSPVPPVSVVNGFEVMAKPVNDKVIFNCGQIKLLEKIRDGLLPKLMSGEVRVNQGGK